MGDAPEVVREVGVNDFRMASEQQPFHLDHRLLGVSPGTVRVLFWWKVGFEDRFQHQHCCCHADPIPHGRDAQRPEFAVGLRSEQSSQPLRRPVPQPLPPRCVRPALSPLPPPGTTRLHRYYHPLRHPTASDLSLARVRLVIADHAMGLPVLRTLSLCTCCRHYPGAAAGRTLRSTSPSRISLPRKGRRVGLRIVLFEACSAFTRVTACTLALSPIRDTLTEGFSHFVTSMTAPIASGWSVCRVGLAPTGKRRLVTAHTRTGH